MSKRFWLTTAAVLVAAAVASALLPSCRGPLRVQEHWTASDLARALCERLPGWEWRPHGPHAALLRHGQCALTWEAAHGVADEATLLPKHRGLLYVGWSFRPLGNATPLFTFPRRHLYLRGHPRDLQDAARLFD